MDEPITAVFCGPVSVENSSFTRGMSSSIRNRA